MIVCRLLGLLTLDWINYINIVETTFLLLTRYLYGVLHLYVYQYNLLPLLSLIFLANLLFYLFFSNLSDTLLAFLLSAMAISAKVNWCISRFWFFLFFMPKDIILWTFYQVFLQVLQRILLAKATQNKKN